MTRPSPEVSAAPRSPETRWWVKNEPRILARLERQLVRGAGGEHGLAGRVELVGELDLEGRRSGPALAAHQRAALAAVDDHHPHVRASPLEPGAQLGVCDPVGPELQRLRVGVAGVVEEQDAAVLRGPPEVGHLLRGAVDGVFELRLAAALQQEQVFGADVAELREDVGDLGGIVLGEVQRLLGRAADVVSDDHRHPPGLGERGRPQGEARSDETERRGEARGA